MSTYLVLTVIGDDKPGLVEMLADTVARHSGNWLESNMSHLAGKFAGILRVSVADAHADALIQLVGNDRPGIIKEISRALALQHVNVEELATQCTAAPMSGESLFNAQAELKVPADLDVRALQRQLEQLADDLIVEIALVSLQ